MLTVGGDSGEGGGKGGGGCDSSVVFREGSAATHRFTPLEPVKPKKMTTKMKRTGMTSRT